MSILGNLLVDWLGQITGYLAVELSKKTVASTDNLYAELVSRKLLKQGKDFESIYKYSYIAYAHKYKENNLWKLFSLKDVCEKFHQYYIGQIEFNILVENLEDQLSQNAYRFEELVSDFYNRKNIDFNKYAINFLLLFNENVINFMDPNEFFTFKNVRQINSKLDHILNEENEKLKIIVNDFIVEYQNNFRIKHANLNLYGISLPYNNNTNLISFKNIYVTPILEESEGNKISRISFSDFSLKDNIYSNFTVHDKSIFLSPSLKALRELSLNFPVTLNENILNAYNYEYFSIQNEFTIADLKNINGRNKIIKNLTSPERFAWYQSTIPDFRSAGVNIESVINYEDNFQKPNNFIELFKYKNNIILGNPGSGKSSLLKYLCTTILFRDFIPIIIVLKDYNNFKIEKIGGLNEFIIQILKSDYQINEIDSKLLNLLFREFKIAILFDGLDEIFDIGQRNDLITDIEIMSKRNINLYSLVTSRYESYNEVKFNDDFIVFKIKDFNTEQINMFINNWFTYINQNSELSKENFSDQLDSINFELKSNPLILTLLVLLYSYDSDLPKSKLEIFEGCTKTLIERRDTVEKKLLSPTKISRYFSLLSWLAYWSYKKSSEMEKIDSYDVKIILIKYLIDNKIIDNHFEAEIYVDEFITYMALRSIYFDNSFTHKSFLEYLTAYYLYSHFQVKAKLNERNEVFIKYLNNSYWHIVLELFIMKLDKEMPDNEIIDSLFSTLLDNCAYDFIMFILPFIQNVNLVSTDVRYKIILRTFQLLGSDIYQTENTLNLMFKNLRETVKINKDKDLINKYILKILSEDYHTIELGIIFEFYLTNNIEIPRDIYGILFSKIDDKNEYNWILKHKNLIEDSFDSYMQYFALFRIAFPKSNLFHSYSSKYSSPIFFKSTIFNWVYSHLFLEDSVKKFKMKYEIIQNFGYTDTKLKKHFKSSNIKVNLSIKTLVELAAIDKYRDLILQILPITIKKGGKNPFYDNVGKRNLLKNKNNKYKK